MKKDTQIILEIDTKVQVLIDPEFGIGPWPAQPKGVIISAPTEVMGKSGLLTQYWVKFEIPQYDGENDGPYTEAQILEKYLRKIE